MNEGSIYKRNFFSDPRRVFIINFPSKEKKKKEPLLPAPSPA